MKEREKLEALQKTELFGQLAETALNKLARFAAEKRLQRRASVYRRRALHRHVCNRIGCAPRFPANSRGP